MELCRHEKTMTFIDQEKINKAIRGWLPVAALLTALLNAFGSPLENWTQRLPTVLGPLSSSIVYGNGVYVSVGGGEGIRISPDATNWVAIRIPTTVNLRAVAYGNGLFVAVGFGTILTSSNGVSWTLVDLKTNVSVLAITFGNGKFVAVGYDYAATSSDGVTWTQAIVPPRGENIDITFGNGVSSRLATTGSCRGRKTA